MYNETININLIINHFIYTVYYINKMFSEVFFTGLYSSLIGISGKRVFHQKFGYGKVLNMDGNKLEIAFEKSGTKIVMKDFIALA